MDGWFKSEGGCVGRQSAEDRFMGINGHLGMLHPLKRFSDSFYIFANSSAAAALEPQLEETVKNYSFKWPVHCKIEKKMCFRGAFVPLGCSAESCLFLEMSALKRSGFSRIYSLYDD